MSNNAGNTYKHEEIDAQGNYLIYKYRNGKKIPRPIANTHPGYTAWIVSNTPDTVAYVAPPAYAADLASAKTKKKDEVKNQARGRLRNTDWYVVRDVETKGVKVVPQSVKDERASIRTQSDNHETAIDALTTIDDVKNYAITWS